MAVVKMMSAEVVGDIGKMAYALSKIGETGVFHPDDIGKFYSDTASFTYTKGENPYITALGALERMCPDCTAGARDTGDMTNKSAFEFVSELERDFNALASEKDKLSASVREKKEKAGHIKYFFGAGVDLSDLTSCRYAHIRFGALQEESADRLEEICKDDDNMVLSPRSPRAVCITEYAAVI